MFFFFLTIWLQCTCNQPLVLCSILIVAKPLLRSQSNCFADRLQAHSWHWWSSIMPGDLLPTGCSCLQKHPHFHCYSCFRCGQTSYDSSAGTTHIVGVAKSRRTAITLIAAETGPMDRYWIANFLPILQKSEIVASYDMKYFSISIISRRIRPSNSGHFWLFLLISQNMSIIQ